MPVLRFSAVTYIILHSTERSSSTVHAVLKITPVERASQQNKNSKSKGMSGAVISAVW
jgi:hypothetical protein